MKPLLFTPIAQPLRTDASVAVANQAFVYSDRGFIHSAWGLYA